MRVRDRYDVHAVRAETTRGLVEAELTVEEPRKTRVFRVWLRYDATEDQVDQIAVRTWWRAEDLVERALDELPGSVLADVQTWVQSADCVKDELSARHTRYLAAWAL